jgi:putative transposase
MQNGNVFVSVPRDRAGSFEPQLIAKGQTRFEGFDDKIVSLYARGMTVREIILTTSCHAPTVSP